MYTYLQKSIGPTGKQIMQDMLSGNIGHAGHEGYAGHSGPKGLVSLTSHAGLECHVSQTSPTIYA